MLEQSEQVKISEKEDVKKIVDYVPTPYRKSLWEGIELVDKNPTFRKIEVEVVEEVNEFDPMFERFDNIRRAEEEVSEQVTDNEAPQITEEMVEEIRALGYQEGFEAGKQEGVAEAQVEIVEKYEHLATSMREITEHIKEEVFKKIEDLEHKSFQLALDVSKRLLITTAEAKPEYILEVIRNGLKHLGASKALKVRVNPQDYEFLEVVGLPEDLTSEGARVQYVADENISTGCVVETDYGELNLELDRMWSEVKNNLFKAIS